MTRRRARALADVVAVDTTEWDGWRVTVHWHRVAGRLVPAGVDVRGFTDDDVHGPTYDQPEPPEAQATTLRRVPLGPILRESRERVAATFEAKAEAVSAWPEAAEHWQQQAAQVRAADSPASAADARYRLAAQVYARNAARDHATAARATWEELGRLGVADRSGQPVNRGTVRRWLAEARRRGYLPPAAE